MKQVLIFGAGRSSTVLIDYLLDEAEKYNWEIVVGDSDFHLAEKKVKGHKHGHAVKVDIQRVKRRRELIQAADVVVSMLPVHMHYIVLKDCIKFRKHLVTASYLSREVYGLEEEIREAAIIMLGEMGLDPGIDHMSAMETINRLRAEGKHITAFRSYTGGLVAPESDNNPWRYKFTWNPKNVVLAGQGTAQFLLEGRYKYIPYNRVFLQTERLNITGLGKFEAYANRDSLLYRQIYGLEDIPTLIRGTIRYPGYCRAWNAFVKLGWTDDTYPIIDSENLTYRQLLESYLRGVYHSYPKGYTIQQRLAEFLGIEADDPVIDKIEWLGIFENEKIGLINATPAQILLDLLLKKWNLEEKDLDMVVMQHQFEYIDNGKKKGIKSSLVMKGEDQTHTAMAKLVGLPLGIFVKLMLLGKVKEVGVHLPVINDIYEPVLEELKTHGVTFIEEEMEVE